MNNEDLIFNGPGVATPANTMKSMFRFRECRDALDDNAFFSKRATGLGKLGIVTNGDAEATIWDFHQAIACGQTPYLSLVTGEIVLRADD